MSTPEDPKITATEVVVEPNGGEDTSDEKSDEKSDEQDS